MLLVVFLDISSNGFCSKIVLSSFKNLNTLVLNTKKPPLIQPSPDCGFSEKFFTKLPPNFMAPNLGEGITAVTVPILLFFVKFNQLCNIHI